MIEQGGEGGLPWWMAGGAAAAWATREIWAALRERRKTRTETDANIELIDSLRSGLDRMDTRIKTMEEAQERMSRRLDEEIAARQAAQELAHRLRLRVEVLESELRKVGAVIPLER